MPDAPSKRKWDKENILLIAIKLNRSKDKDVIDFIGDRNKHDVVCEAIRYYMANHNEKGE